MNEQTEAKLHELEERLKHMYRYLDIAKKDQRVQELSALMGKADFWNDHLKAQNLIDESNTLKSWVIPYQDLSLRFENIKELFPEADDNFTIELTSEMQKIDKELAELEARKMLSGEFDAKNCFFSINSGAGGTEACDWVSMLARMYQRWASKKGWRIDVLDTVEGDVAGFKSITMKFTGPFAFGFSKAEKGVHRLVRISPFDSNARRHTSFASVDVTPEIDDDIAVEIKPDQIRVDTYRASGAGGQHVNKTDSAVRITHLPSGIVVSCQGERSQTQNKENCLKMLRAKLYEKETKERKQKIEEMGGEKEEIAWGHQIRSYVFQPYMLIKDNRTGVEKGDIASVMDGEIDDFVYAYLKEYGNS